MMTVQTLEVENKIVNLVRPVKAFFNLPRQRAYDTLPCDDGEVLETKWHRDCMSQLIEIMMVSWEGSARAFINGNMFVYFDPHQVKNHNFRGPDFFVVKDVDPDPDRKSWVVWDENNRAPDMVIELSSPSTKEVDFGQKKRQYEQILKVKDYFIYDPDSQKLVGWRLQGGVYVALLPNEHGWLWCEELKLWLGVYYGVYQKHLSYYPRFFDEQGQLLLNSWELKEREQQRAEQAELGAEQAQLQAEQAQLEAKQAQFQAKQAQFQAEQARRDKEQAQFQAEQARHDKEQAQLQAEQARHDKERLAAKLRELGIDPTTVLN